MQIRFYLLRTPEIEVDGRSVYDELNHKSAALLFYPQPPVRRGVQEAVRSVRQAGPGAPGHRAHDQAA